MPHGIRTMTGADLDAAHMVAYMKRLPAVGAAIERERQRREDEDLRNADDAYYAKIADGLESEDEVNAHWAHVSRISA